MSRGKVLAAVRLHCEKCHYKIMVKPQQVPSPCPECRTNMYPERGWHLPPQDFLPKDKTPALDDDEGDE